MRGYLQGRAGTDPDPAQQPTEDDDGLLTASEVRSSSSMPTGWCCRPATRQPAAATLGAEALSGLARAFFYAGARALLVSHWAVNSRSHRQPRHQGLRRAQGRAEHRPRRGAAPVDAGARRLWGRFCSPSQLEPFYSGGRGCPTTAVAEFSDLAQSLRTLVAANTSASEAKADVDRTPWPSPDPHQTSQAYPGRRVVVSPTPYSIYVALRFEAGRSGIQQAKAVQHELQALPASLPSQLDREVSVPFAYVMRSPVACFHAAERGQHIVRVPHQTCGPIRPNHVRCNRMPHRRGGECDRVCLLTARPNQLVVLRK